MGGEGDLRRRRTTYRLNEGGYWIHDIKVSIIIIFLNFAIE